MPQAVIVAATRSPIGRAFKGSLIAMRPDDLCAAIIKSLLQKLPALNPAEIEDVIMGCAQPAGESGYNIGRVASILSGLPDVPGTTVNRYCSSSLQTIRMAAHAIKAGEGDIFIAGGVETVSRFQQGKADGMEGTKNPIFLDADRGLPNIYIAMGETAEVVADHRYVLERLVPDTDQSRSLDRRGDAAIFDQPGLRGGEIEAAADDVDLPPSEGGGVDAVLDRRDDIAGSVIAR